MYQCAILGSDCLPWLGNLNKLGPAAEFLVPPYGEDAQSGQSPFPVAPAYKHSYAQNCIVWTKNAGLQVTSDLIVVCTLCTFTATENEDAFQCHATLEL